MWEAIKLFFRGAKESMSEFVWFMVLLILTLAGVLFWLVSKMAMMDEKKTIAIIRGDLHKEHASKLGELEDDEEAAIKLIEEEYAIKLDDLDEREVKLNESMSAGPVAIALEWKKYMRSKK